MSLSSLPAELQLKIFSHLDHSSLLAMSEVSKDFNIFSRDPSLENPRIKPHVFENLMNKNFALSRLDISIPQAYEYYLHLENGEPKLTEFKNTDKDFKGKIANRTEITRKAYYSNIYSKQIKIDDTLFTLENNTLYINGEAKVYDVKDIACMNGYIIYTRPYYSGLNIYDPQFSHSYDNRWSDKGRIIADGVTFNQIVCDEKKGVIYGLKTDGKVEKLDYSVSSQEIRKDNSRLLYKTVSYIGRLILKTLGNLVLYPIGFLAATWKVNAIAVTCAFVFGCALAFFVAAPIFPVGLGFVILVEIPFSAVCVSMGLLSGVIVTLSDVVSGKI